MAAPRTIVQRILVVAVIVAMTVMFRTMPIGEWLVELEAWVRANPGVGALTYMVLAILAIVAFTPGWIPMMLAGLVFGFLPGFLWAMIAVVIGATTAMIAGRTLLRRWVEKRVAGNARLAALDDALAERALYIVFLTRVALVIPFNLLNYAYGLTRVRTSGYALATAIGMLPVVAMYVYLGTLARDIGQILEGGSETGIGIWWILGFAAVAITLIAMLVRRAVSDALSRQLASKSENDVDANDKD